VDSHLVFAEELERRDAQVARRIDDVESRQRAVDDVRRALADADVQLRRLPEQRRAQERDEAVAFDARSQAVTAVRESEENLRRARESDRLAAERRLDDARAALNTVEREIQALERRRSALEVEEVAALDQVASAGRRAIALGAAADVTGAPSDVIEVVGEWAAHERGVLLVEHSNLVRERDTVVREASELLASVLGDATALTSVAGLRARLERASGSWP
jgi:chromosome segregation ATPase